ncbi:hypothetical protein [Methylobacterium frigidaeris]|uniref:Uncharacterized protein n=1 Tax=Methylobacterium frigidaeris TaxID=2038277 RepID=A0AA37M7G5_9HYPH|nr:hypothetical protein [Methylobacterium frigidaeris]PIK70159.1 hypothetical protein CS379_26140 [Methylobacterium frigidaeris]GJD65197.1 hypothetical protein MPEAHAMD_5384 [Methylobacterium frigidaeris]
MSAQTLLAEILEAPMLAPRIVVAEDGPALVYCDGAGRHKALRLTEIALAELQLSLAEAQARLARTRLPSDA